MNTLEVHSALDAGKQVANKLDTTESAKKLYSVLLALSYDWIQHKAYRAIPTHVTLHSSLTLVSAVIGINRVTAWRSLARLKNLGVVDWKSHKCTFRGRASNSGTIFQVRLHATKGTRAKLAYHDLAHNWHSLDRASRDKAMSYQTVQHIDKISTIEVKYQMLKEWTLKIYTKTVVNQYKLHAGIDALLAVPNSRGKEVHKVVDRAARAMSDALQDAKSLNMYRRILWRLKSRLNMSGSDEFYTLHTQVLRIVNGDMAEVGSLKRPGALLLSRLSKYSWWEEVLRV